MKPLLRLALVLAASGCGSPREEPPPTPNECPATEAPPAEPATAEPATAEPADPEIGWTELPEPPSEEARAANREALRVHATGDYAASEALFGELSRANPSYAMAHFNHACALARLGRIDEAALVLAPLLAADLPTIGPRLQADPDLAALRASPAGQRLAALRARLLARYLDALARGAPMISVRSGIPDVAAAQPGVWLHVERRFVPLAPRVESPPSREDDDRVFATGIVDRELGRVVTVTGRAPFSEGDEPLTPLDITAFAAGAGTELGSAHWGGLWECIVVHATAGGAAASAAEDGTTLVGAGAFDAAHVPRLRVCNGGAVGTFDEARTDVAVYGRRASLRLGDRTARVTLGPEHPRASRDLEVTVAPATGPRVWVRTEATEPRPGAGWGEAIALSWIDFEQGLVVPLAQGHGTAAMLMGPDGALYAEIGFTGSPTRYAVGAPPEPLIDGLTILPFPRSFSLMNWAVGE